jgi:hypothetical protein
MERPGKAGDASEGESMKDVWEDRVVFWKFIKELPVEPMQTTIEELEKLCETVPKQYGLELMRGANYLAMVKVARRGAKMNEEHVPPAFRRAAEKQQEERATKTAAKAAEKRPGEIVPFNRRGEGNAED